MDELDVPFLLALALAVAPTASASSDDPEIARLNELGERMQAIIDRSSDPKTLPRLSSKSTLGPEIGRLLREGGKFGSEKASSLSPQEHLRISNAARLPWNGQVALEPGSPEWVADRDARRKAAWSNFWRHLLSDHVEPLGIFLVCLAHAVILAFFAGKRQLRPASFAFLASISGCLMCYLGWYPYFYQVQETIFSPNAISGYVIFLLATAVSYSIGRKLPKLYSRNPDKKKALFLR